jgi:hypothetical protein
MPFTPAHTAAVLPWLRKPRLSATALVMGSMAPDFEYFIRIDVKGVWGHDLAGIFLFDLPVSIALVALFHRVVKNNLINNLPAFIQLRFAHLKRLTLQEDLLARPLTFAFCACLGALTHVAWDGFTHGTGFFVRQMTWLYDDAVVPFDGVRYPLWYALQHASTAVGLLILIIYIFRMKPAATNAVRPRIWYWVALTLITAAVVVVRLQFPHQTGAPMIAISIISGLCISVIVLGLFPAAGEIAPEQT